MSEPIPEPTPQVIRAGTVNLARLMPETEARAALIIAEIDSMDLYVIGLQEAEEWIETKMARRLKGSWIVVSDNVNCPAMVRSDLFEKVSHNGRSSVGITMPGSVRKRYGSAALLRRKSDGFTFVFATIHPSNSGESSHSAEDRIRQAESCWQHFVTWGVTDFPILLVGDMNAREMPPNGLPGVFVAHGMVDVLAELGQKARIDRAFLKGFTPLSATVNDVASSASDHDFGIFEVVPGAVIPPPDQPPPVQTVTMYVRPKGDPIWKRPPYELTARDFRGNFINSRVRQPGYKVVGVETELIGDRFIRTQHNSYYRKSYLTTVKP